MANQLFQQVATARPRRSVFDLSYEKKMTGDMGKLYPVLCEECVPGDKWSIGNRALFRLQPMVAPMMHEVNVFVHYFFVPYRAMWSGWEDFITGGVDGDDVQVLPRWTISTAEAPGSLWDYLGFPLVVPLGAMPCDFPRIAYNWIWNEYYRNQNLQDEVALTNGEILVRNWEKDYFTASLPWQQRGQSPALPYGGNTTAVFPGDGGSTAITFGGSATSPYHPDTNTARGLNTNTVDLGSSLFDIADLRLAMQIQRFLERNARAGARYVEFLKSHFQVSYNDSRLQRPEYIGGTRAPIQVSEVLQTSGSPVDPATGYTPTAQGNMAGHGIGVSSGFAGSYFVEEFGLIMGLMSVMPRTAYQDGINRQWLRETRYDYYFPEFAHLSEQAVLNAEVCATGIEAENTDIWGYQGRYDEMRIKSSMTVAGMRNTFDYWHLGRKFDTASPPVLDSTFIQCVPDKRVFAVQDEDCMIINFGNVVRAVRPLPVLAEPGFIDHG